MSAVYPATPNIRPGPNDAYADQRQPSSLPGGPPQIIANNRAPHPGTTQSAQHTGPRNGSTSNDTGQPFPELGRAGSVLGWVLDWVAPRSRESQGPSANGNLPLMRSNLFNFSAWAI